MHLRGPTSADRLTIAVPAEIGGPLNVLVQFREQVSELVYDKLLAPSPYVDEPQPWLASEVRMLDPSTWEVTVRDGVTWHDGEPFTAEDVAFTFSYARDAPTGRFTHHINEIPDISSVELLDADTLRFSCAFACPDLGPVTLADLPILPAHIWSQVPPDQAKSYAELPVGTGPYRLTDFDPVTGYRFAHGSYADLSTSRDYDLQLGSITAHGTADPTQFIMSRRSGYLWDAPEIPYPEWDALFERWKAASTVADRRDVAFAMQQLFNRRPTSIPLFYPDEYWAFRPDAFAGWVESPGFGIVHKWSLLPREVARDARAIVETG